MTAAGRGAILVASAIAIAGCSSELGGGTSSGASTPSPATTGSASVVSAVPAPPSSAVRCHEGRTLTVHFYDVGQALAVLVDLPDGRHVLVDAGDTPRRAGCLACEAEHAHLESALRRDLGGAPLDLVWNTHPHSDHVGGVPAVLEAFRVLTYVDNGRGSDKPEVRAAREAAARRRVAYLRIEPGSVVAALPALAPNGESFSVRPIVPPAWTASCVHDENECSIGLRIDFCGSSVLFTGDAEHEEETHLDPLGPATLLQVGHHGSDTSSSARFLARVAPRYAVVSAGHPDDDRNREYCHPRALAMRRLSHALVERGGGENAHLQAYEGPCKEGTRAGAGDWVSLPVSGRLFATERDGDVVLTTTGDGTFARRESRDPR